MKVTLKIGTKVSIVAGVLLIIALAVVGVISYTSASSVLIVLASAIAFVCVMGVLLLFVRQQIGKPLKKIVGFAKALADGERDAVVEIRSQDEIGQLSFILGKEIRGALQTIEDNRIIFQKQREYEALQVDQLVVNLERLSAGDLRCDMQASEPDEDTQELYTLFAGVSESLHKSVDTIKGYVDEISHILGEMSSNNLRVEITSDYQGDFAELKDSINAIIRSFSETLLDFNMAADQVASGAAQVSDGNQEVSQGATEQASAIEEVSSSITQMAHQIKENAEHANTSKELANQAREAANNGNEKMKRMLTSMDEINEASNNISKIIKVIDDIAFQTNILALNAAVEAARAGVHGKGFAVVAEEVRNLAARSANAASETTAMIEGSTKKVKAGTAIANETAEALSGIVSGTEKAEKLNDEIAVASNEQATGIAQINERIDQLSQVVQTNSATAEQGAAASEELSSQALLFKDMVDEFQLDYKYKRTGASHPIAQKTPGDDGGEPVHTEKPEIVLNDSEFGKY